MRDLQGLPRTQQRSSEEFFDLLEKDITDRPIQIGELYFEYHRGTYTSQALVKRNNRKAEFLLHDLEFVAAISNKPYPRDAINQLWEVLLLNQFHDILPGSSIREVYEDSAAQFRDLFENGEKLIRCDCGARQDDAQHDQLFAKRCRGARRKASVRARIPPRRGNRGGSGRSCDHRAEIGHVRSAATNT